MTKKTFTAAERQHIAAGWQTSGMPQPEYAALHGISDRTLREWIARNAAPEAPVEAVRRVLRRTIAELERMLEGLSGTESEHGISNLLDSEGEVPPAPAGPAAQPQPAEPAATQPVRAEPEIATATACPSTAAGGTAASHEVGFLFELDEA